MRSQKKLIKKDKRIDFTKAILFAVAAAGLIAAAVITPAASAGLPILAKHYYFNYYIKSRVRRMKDAGLIVFVNKDGKQYARLTDKGKVKLRKYQYGELKISKPRRWDGKWRIVIFDIREQRKSIRNQLRQQLINFGLIKLQRSVWVHPYDFSELLMLLKSDFKIGKDVLYLTVEKLENDPWLKERFGLE